MKKAIVIIFSLLANATVVLGQAQQGLVKTKGRLGEDGNVIPGTRLPGVLIQIKGRTQLMTRQDGTFSFPATDEYYYLQNVKKEEYLLMDPDMINRRYSYSDDPLIVVMDNRDQYLDDKLIAERKIRRTLQNELRIKENEIERLKQQRQLSDEEYRNQLQLLYDQQENNEGLIREMAERFAQMDFDAIDKLNRKVSQLILEGKLTEADSIINSKGSIEKRANTLLKQQKANLQTETDLNKQLKRLENNKELTKKELIDLAADCYSKYEIATMRHQIDSAAYFLAFRSNLDTTNIIWLLKYSSFLADAMGKYHQALEIDQHGLAMVLNNGSENNSAAQCYCHMGLMYNELGDYQNAVTCLSHVLELTENKEILFRAYNNLGVVFDDQRLFDEAITYLNQSLGIGIELYGEHSDEVAGCYNNLGYIYNEIMKPDIALEYHLKALDILTAIHGETHMDVGLTLTNIAGVYYIKTDFDTALDYLLKAKEIFEKTLSPRHSRMGLLYNNISSCYEKKGDFDNSIIMGLKSIDILESELGRNHPKVATMYGNIGHVYETMGQFDMAVQYTQQAIERLTYTFGEQSQGSLNVAVHYSALGRQYKAIGDLSKAEAALKKCLEIELSIIDKPNVYLFNAYNQLAEFYFERNNYASALKYYREMQEPTKIAFGPQCTELIGVLGGIYFSLIGIYQESGLEEDLKAFRDFMSNHALTLMVIGPDSPAAKLGLDGIYFLLAIEDWEQDSPITFYDCVQSYLGKAKRVVLIRDGVVYERVFTNSLGMRNGFVEISKEEKKEIMDTYLKWKQSH